MSAGATALTEDQKAILKVLGTRQDTFTPDQKATYQILVKRADTSANVKSKPTNYLGFAGEFAKEMFKPRPQVALGAVKQAAKNAMPAIDPVFGSISKPQALEPKNPEQSAGAAQESAVELLPVAGTAARGAAALKAALSEGPGLVERALTGLASKSENLSKPTQFILKSTPGVKTYFENLQKMFGPDLGKMAKLDTKQLAAKLYQEATGKLPGTAQEQVDAMKALRAALKEAKPAATPTAKIPPVKYLPKPPATPAVSASADAKAQSLARGVKFKPTAPAEAAEVAEVATKPTAAPTARPEPPASVRSGHAGSDAPALRGAAEDVVHRNAQAKDIKMVEYFKSKGIDPDAISDADFNKHLAANGFKPAPAKYDPKLMRRAMSAVRADIRSLMKKQ